MALGIVSTAPFTRAEFETAIKKAVYSEGQLVYTGSASFTYNSDGSLSLPDTVDYVKLTCSGGKGDYLKYYYVPAGTLLTRGTQIYTNRGDFYAKITFAASGTLIFVGYNSVSKGDRADYLVAGYHYY